jgi:hypothetical protein
MKKYVKWIALALAVAMIIMTIGCSASTSNEAAVYSNAEDLLDAVWGAAKENGSEISIAGGAGETAEMDKPAALDLEQADIAAATYSVPTAVAEKAVSGAGLMNAMMANYLTVSAWQFASASERDDAAKEAADYLEQMDWLCAMPDKYYIYGVDDFAVIVYGISDQTEAFVKACESLFGKDALLYSGTYQ